jgi:pimeloyl-ACP methyl ester carboxylesterase
MDLRNHGDSPWAGEMCYPDMAADVAATLDAAGIRQPVLLGHSMGGKTAMALAQLRLAPLAGLIVADIAPVPYRHDHDEFIQAMERLDLSRVNSRGDADRQMADSVDEPGIRQFLLQNLVRDGETYRWRINIGAIRRNLPRLLDWDLSEPSEIAALFIAGEQSDYVSREGRDAIRRMYPGAVIETMAGAGHWLHAEQPRRFSTLVGDYLSAVSPVD